MYMYIHVGMINLQATTWIVNTFCDYLKGVLLHVALNFGTEYLFLVMYTM